MLIYEAQPAILTVYQTQRLQSHHLVTTTHETSFEKILFNDHASNTAYVYHNLSHWSYIGKKIWFTMQQRRHFPKRLKRNATCEGNAIDRSSKLSHESSEIRNKRQFHFWAIICPNPKWHSCFYYEQLSVPIDGSANFKFLALSCPNECNKYRPRTVARYAAVPTMGA
jgi:hypothetical protein